MSYLEHLVENGLVAYMLTNSEKAWRERMAADPNWKYVERLNTDDLWEICEYVFWVWMPTNAPKTKPVKYFDEVEKIWKIGEVIVNA